MDIKEFVKYADDNCIEYDLREPLSCHTTLRMGGPAEIFARPSSVKQIAELVRFCRKYAYKYDVLGRGSNILALDSGFDGMIINIGSAFSGCSLVDENTVYCKSGTDVSALCKFCLENSLSGLEFAYGIPGSVGGLVFMNAGAYGGEAKDVLISSDYVDEFGNTGKYDLDELEMGYRKSRYMSENKIITGAYFRLQKDDHDKIKGKMDSLIEMRMEKQPLDKASAGSTFKRPEGAFAAELIERCGLKGFTMGNVSVSGKHAGFLVNDNKGSAAEMLELMDYVSKTVEERTGYVLEPEVRIIGK